MQRRLPPLSLCSFGTGRVFIAVNGEDHLEELFDVGAAIGRTSLIKKQALVRLDTAPVLLGKYFDGVKQERAPGAVEVKDAKPVVDYLGTVGDEGLLNDEERSVAIGLVESVIQEKGFFRIGKRMIRFEGVARKDGGVTTCAQGGSDCKAVRAGFVRR
jgi:hypothetical protein